MSLGKQMSVWRRGFREGEVLCLKAVGTHTNLIRVAQKECGNVALPRQGLKLLFTRHRGFEYYLELGERIHHDLGSGTAEADGLLVSFFAKLGDCWFLLSPVPSLA